MVSLPIDPFVPEIARLVRERGAVVVVAPPGAGKTTRVPPALVGRGPAILLQPRRLAARALARRIAEERGWSLGEEVGWQVRFERRFTARTRLLVATEGILTARFQDDPLLSGFATVILDEFHERSIHADLALALARQARIARGDLAVVVMSATLDAAPVAAYLGGCPIVEVPGRPFPVEIAYEPHLGPAEAIRQTLRRPGGHVLCFLPGAPEITRLGREIEPIVGDAKVFPLHGTLDADAQDAAIAPSRARKVILATNVAETSLTVDGTTDVVDTGQHKVLRADDELGLDRLDAERISRDAADQRAGRAGRTGPGRATRLWDPREEMRPHREPEIERADLAATALDLLAWGGDPRTFAWFEAPPAERLDAALSLLERLGAVSDGRLTDLGRVLRRFPLHPRLSRVLVAAGGSRAAAAACAVLSERWVVRDAPVATDSDVLARADEIARAPHGVRQAADEIAALSRRLVDPGPAEATDEILRRALLAGYADRVAKRRAPGSPRLLMASGTGAVLGRESGVREGDFLVCVDVVASRRGPGSEAIVRAASRVEKDWLVPDRRVTEHVFDGEAGAVRAFERACLGALVVEERPVAPDPEMSGPLVAEEALRRGLGEGNDALLRRLRFAGIEIDLAAAVDAAFSGATRLAPIDLASFLPHGAVRDLDRLAPERLAVPSGRAITLDYREDGTVVCAVKLQELFGLAETPVLGPRRAPVVFELLAPNGRPVQTTRDLRSFWERTYPEVRKELRGRYPKHPWPDDPWTARPTHRAKPRP